MTPFCKKKGSGNGSVKMHETTGKILAALNGNFAINFADRVNNGTIHKVILRNKRHSTATLSCVLVYLSFGLVLRQQRVHKDN